MRLHKREIEAIDEQLATTLGNLDPENLKRKRRTETILISMVDNLPSLWEPEDPNDPDKPKKRRRRRRRGPRTLTANYL